MEIKTIAQKIFRWPVILGLVLILFAIYFSNYYMEEPIADEGPSLISDPVYFSRDGMPCMFTQIVEDGHVYGGITCDWTKWRYRNGVSESTPTPTHMPPFLPTPP